MSSHVLRNYCASECFHVFQLPTFSPNLITLDSAAKQIVLRKSVLFKGVGFQTKKALKMWGRERCRRLQRHFFVSASVMWRDWQKPPRMHKKGLFGEYFCLNYCWMNQFRTWDVLARNNHLHCARAVSDTYLAELFLHKQCAAFMIEPIWNSEISRDYKNANKIVQWSLFHNVLRALNSPDFEAFSAFWVDSVVLECEEKPLWHVFFFKSDLLANRSVNKTCNWNRELADLSGSFYGRSFT